MIRDMWKKDRDGIGLGIGMEKDRSCNIFQEIQKRIEMIRGMIYVDRMIGLGMEKHIDEVDFKRGRKGLKWLE